MKAAILAPTALLRRYAVTDYHLALAHLVLNDAAYKNFYSACSTQAHFVMMDNGVIELDEPLPMNDVIRAALAVSAEEVVIPDYPGEALKTADSAYDWSNWMYENWGKRFRVMAVPQGHDFDSWIACFLTIVELPYVDTIGVPKSLGHMRLRALRTIHEGQENLPHKQYHMLGTWGNPTEVQYAAKTFPWVRGVDSKIPVRAGLAGVQFHPELGLMTDRYQLPPLNFSTTSDSFPVVTQYNVNRFIAWARGEGLAEVRSIV